MASSFGKRHLFGTDSENYVSRLFMMMNNPNGSRRPDLVSINGRYTPKLTLEVKSSKDKKGSLVRDQLHYAITSNEDYEEIFGEPKKIKIGELFGDDSVPIQNKTPEGITYYYDLIKRTNPIKCNSLRNRFYPIKLTWGDQYIVPNEFGFYEFAAGMITRTNQDHDSVIKYLENIIQKQALGGEIDHEDECDPQRWQNLNEIDILAIMEKDLSLTSQKGRKRLDIIRKYYPQVDDLEKIEIPGPNKSTIYILSKPEDYNLFDKQVRTTVEERIPLIEEVNKERENSFHLLKKAAPIRISETDMYGNEIERLRHELSREEESELERLLMWLPRGEIPLDNIPF